MDDQSAEPHGVDWRAGEVPVSRRFDDPYFSLNGGLEETRHVFLAGNGLPGRFDAMTGDFHVAELGFGTGLNFLATLAAFRAAPRRGRLIFTSFEAYPLARADLARALAAFPALPVAAVLDPGGDDHVLTIVPGDVGESLPGWDGRADAWFLDGFAPAKNPGMWTEAVLRAVAAQTAPGGTFATYTAAGHVRRALAAAGFAVERVAGYGTKRHMTRGVLQGITGGGR